MSTLSPLDPQATALVLIDLQHGIVGRPVEPRSGVEVVANAARLAARFRERGGTVVLIRVAFSADRRDVLAPVSDAPAPAPVNPPPNWAEIVPELGPREGDIVIVKRQWGAFHGTELDLQLRRRGIQTLVLGGIATNIGVESTARAAYELGYQQVFAEDAMSSISTAAHEFTVRTIFPRIGRVRSTDAILEAI